MLTDLFKIPLENLRNKKTLKIAHKRGLALTYQPKKKINVAGIHLLRWASLYLAYSTCFSSTTLGLSWNTGYRVQNPTPAF